MYVSSVSRAQASACPEDSGMRRCNPQAPQPPTSPRSRTPSPSDLTRLPGLFLALALRSLVHILHIRMRKSQCENRKKRGLPSSRVREPGNEESEADDVQPKRTALLLKAEEKRVEAEPGMYRQNTKEMPHAEDAKGEEEGKAAEGNFGPVIVSSWRDHQEANEYCSRLLEACSSAPKTVSARTAGESSPAVIACGMDCEWCPVWWQRDGGGDVIQLLQIYSPCVGTLGEPLSN